VVVDVAVERGAKAMEEAHRAQFRCSPWLTPRVRPLRPSEHARCPAAQSRTRGSDLSLISTTQLAGANERGANHAPRDGAGAAAGRGLSLDRPHGNR
jgi:hypothetical protein